MCLLLGLSGALSITAKVINVLSQPGHSTAVLVRNGNELFMDAYRGPCHRKRHVWSPNGCSDL